LGVRKGTVKPLFRYEEEEDKEEKLRFITHVAILLVYRLKQKVIRRL
jgi:hypothetical protein